MSEFYPLPRLISGISQAVNAVITFTENHGYKNGQLLRFHVPREYGMYEMNEKSARVLSNTNTTVTVNIETTNFSSFIYPATSDSYPPEAVPYGSGIDNDQVVHETNLECSFDNRP